MDIKTFRPKARLIATIGSEIIKDKYAAIIELVKNAYDADANEVIIEFEICQQNLRIIIEDNGYGMSKDTIINKWLVPATNDKLVNKKSPNGRKVQGKKGIGRFSAAILGNKLTLTSWRDGIESKIYINWDLFSNDNYLDEIGIEISENKTNHQNGTRFEITSCIDNKYWWTRAEIDALVKELRKTMTPTLNNKKDDFDILLNIDPNIALGYSNVKIAPFPILDMYSYKVKGTVIKNRIKYNFENKYLDTIETFEIPLIKDNESICGNLKFEFRIFDREKDNIENITKNEAFKGLIGTKPSKDDVRQLINEICGVFIYRNDFRIRPYGDEGFDWLSLDKKRVQDPSLHIGTDQIYGIIEIEDEEISNLVDKSARDGLKDNDSYENFKKIILTIISNVETTRRAYRVNSGKGLVKKERKINLNDKLTQLVSSSNINENIKKLNISNEDKEKITKFFKDEQQTKEKIAQEIQNEIAIYQGQATLGKIMNLILHEARKPLGWFINTSTSMPIFVAEYKKSRDDLYLEKLISQAETSKEQAILLDDLFKKLNPLATRQRGNCTNVNVLKVISDAFEIFKNKFEKECIKFEIEASKDTTFFGYRIDLLMALTNIIENSLYWLQQCENENKKVFIKVKDNGISIVIDILDNGVGINVDDIRSCVIFEPGVSRKIGGGTGLGLPIAGEAIARNGGQLRAIEQEHGAHLQIELPKMGV